MMKIGCFAFGLVRNFKLWRAARVAVWLQVTGLQGARWIMQTPQRVTTQSGLTHGQDEYFFFQILNKRNPSLNALLLLHASQSHHNPVKVPPLVRPVDAARPQDAGPKQVSVCNEKLTGKIFTEHMKETHLILERRTGLREKKCSRKEILVTLSFQVFVWNFTNKGKIFVLKGDANEIKQDEDHILRIKLTLKRWKFTNKVEISWIKLMQNVEILWIA